MMEHLQFIRISSNEKMQNTPEEIQVAFDCLIKYCEEHSEDPLGLQNMLYIHEILSIYSFRERNQLELKKSTSYCPYARGNSIRFSPNKI